MIYGAPISFARWQTALGGWQTALSKRQVQQAMENLEPEDVWLRFFLRRLRLAKSPETAAVLKELIAEAEERLDRLESGDDSGHATD